MSRQRWKGSMFQECLVATLDANVSGVTLCVVEESPPFRGRGGSTSGAGYKSVHRPRFLCKNPRPQHHGSRHRKRCRFDKLRCSFGNGDRSKFPRNRRQRNSLAQGSSNRQLVHRSVARVHAPPATKSTTSTGSSALSRFGSCAWVAFCCGVVFSSCFG